MQLRVDQQASLEDKTERAGVGDPGAGQFAVLEHGGGQGRPMPMSVVQIAGFETGFAQVAKRKIGARRSATRKGAAPKIEPGEIGLGKVPSGKANEGRPVLQRLLNVITGRWPVWRPRLG